MNKSTAQRKFPPRSSGTYLLGGDMVVNRLGFGAMRVTGPNVWGPPKDKQAAVALLRRAFELGANLFDTADSYGPQISELLIAEALHPYPEGLVIATKGGVRRSFPSDWSVDGSREHMRAAVEASLKRLRLERIDLYQLHGVGDRTPLEETVAVLAEMREEGKIRHIGLCNVDSHQLQRARAVAPIVSVQNQYNLAFRRHDALIDHCAEEGLGFIPWFPLAMGALTRRQGKLAEVAARLGATPAQVALAWLLERSPNVLPIPGTGSIEHMEENMAAAGLRLPADDFRFLTEPVQQAAAS